MMSFMNSSGKFFCIDTETGGLTTDCSLLTLHGKILDANLQVLSWIDIKLKPDDGKFICTAEALKINKINLVDHASAAITYTEGLKVIEHFLSSSIGNQSENKKLIPIGHNLAFDKGFILSHLKLNWDKYLSHKYIDTVVVGEFLKLSQKVPERVGALSGYAKTLGVKTDALHEASADVDLTIEILRKFKNL
jgi:DNA polymerase III alpha subunit (gram-positive type)